MKADIVEVLVDSGIVAIGGMLVNSMLISKVPQLVSLLAKIPDFGVGISWGVVLGGAALLFLKRNYT